MSSPTPYKSRASRRKSDVRDDGNRQPIIEVDPEEPGLPPRSSLAHHAFRPTPSQRVMVAALAACNVGHDGIAAYIRVNEETLRRSFRYEIDEGYDRTEAALVGVLVAKALGGNMTAINTLLKCVFGWSESGKKPDGQTTIEALSAEQRVEIIKALRESLDSPKAGSGTRGKNKAHLVAVAGTANGSDRESG